MFIIKPSQPAFKSSWASGKKNEICDFWVHGRPHDQEQNGNPSAFRQSFENENGCDRLYQEKIVEIQKFCFHGSNVTFLLSSRGEWERVLLTEVNEIKTHCCQAFENISISRAIRAAEYLKICFRLAV